MSLAYHPLTNPSSLPGLHTWYDASQLTPGVISSWADRTGNGHTATQATPSLQPSCVVAADGKQEVVFDGIGMVLKTSTFTAVPQPFTICAVVRAGKGTINDEVAVGADGTPGSSYLVDVLSNGYFGTMIGTAYTQFTYSGAKENRRRVFTTTARNGQRTKGRVDSQAPTTAYVTLGLSNITALSLGASTLTGGNLYPLLGAVCEVLLYSRELTVIELQRVERYLHNKWGVYTPRDLPAQRGMSHVGGKVGVVTQLRRLTKPDTTTFGSTDRLAQLNAIAGMGVRWVREGFDWPNIQTSAGVWDWTRYDDIMTQAANAGVDVLPILTYSPTWENGGADKFRPPASNANYQEYCRQVMARYGSTGTFWAANPALPFRPLRAAEIWNEPWLYEFWQPTPDAAAYAALARAGIAGVRAGDPNAIVMIAADINQIDVIGGTHVENPWLTALYAADPGLFALTDAYSVHPYPSLPTTGCYFEDAPPHDFGRVTMIRDMLASYGVLKPIWITEVGWSTADPSVYGMDEATVASFCGQAIRRVSREWPDFIERIFLYAYDYSSDISSDWNGCLPWLHPDGSQKTQVITEITGWHTEDRASGAYSKGVYGAGNYGG